MRSRRLILTLAGVRRSPRAYAIALAFASLGLGSLAHFVPRVGTAVDELVEGLFRSNVNFILAVAFIALVTVRSRTNAARRLIERQSRLFAAAKNSALNEITGGLAHEINNPLSIVLGRLEQLRESVEDAPLDRAVIIQKISRIEATAQRISSIVNQLRVLAAGDEHEAFRTVSVRALFDETIELRREHLRAKGVMLEFNEVPPELQVECQTARLSQALLNLIDNAADAAEKTPERWIRLSARHHGDTVLITVADSGRGIPRPLREKIMQPFFTTKEIGKGTGLGLNVARGIVESHGGTVALDVNNPRTAFTLRLPRRQTKANNLKPAA